MQYQEISRRAAAALEDYNNSILALLRAPIRWKSDEDRALGVELDSLVLTPEARALYVGFANATEKEMGPKGTLFSAKAFASKLPENAARLAGVLTLIEDPQAKAIHETTLANGMELSKFYLSEALRLLASGAFDPALRQAETLREWLLAQESDVSCRIERSVTVALISACIEGLD